MTKNLELIRLILYYGSGMGWFEQTQGFSAAAFRDFKIKENLINLTGNETVPDGTTGLMFAVGEGYVELVRELLRRGANPFQANRYGDDAFSIVEIQLHRVLLHNKKNLYAIYKQIANLLDEYARERAKDIARAISILMTSQIVRNPDGTVGARSGLPYEMALRIAIADRNIQEQQRILRYLERLTPEEWAAIRAETHPEMPVTTPTLLERLGHYMPAWSLAALSYYFARTSNP
jgi:hypothetical protein